MSFQLEFGANRLAEGGVRFRVSAPAAQSVSVEIFGPTHAGEHVLQPEGNAAFSLIVPSARSGSLYKFRIDGLQSYPDPYSRFQPQGVHGPSEVVDPTSYQWRDAQWPGIAAPDLVIYECHVGTYTLRGTFAALASQLDELHRLGITALELMPVAEFPGARNWGYDGVDLFAPSRNYGRPDDLRRLVDAAHQRGLAVLLDVVYNHLGPDGNYLRAYAPQYFTDRYKTPWGDALNYDGPDSHYMRHLAVQNACYWLNEYHFDGLRLDATHAIYDSSRRHILQEIAESARRSVQGRQVVIIAEDSNNDVQHVRPVTKGGRGLDAVWADDFHHTVRAFLTKERDGYFADYHGTLDEVATTIQDGFLYQGQSSTYFGRPRGTKASDEPASAFVFCLQNHDQVGNRAYGDRLNHLIDQATFLVASAVLLLAPEIPLLFMGQEFAASSPFRYFTDHEAELGRLVTTGRREEFQRFAAFADPAQRERIPDPQAEATFHSSKLNLSERVSNAQVYRCYKDLLALRRSDPVFRCSDRFHLSSVALSPTILAVHRWQGHQHRLLLANFGETGTLVLPEEISLMQWKLMWSTAKPEYVESAEQKRGRNTVPVASGEEGPMQSVTLRKKVAVLMTG